MHLVPGRQLGNCLLALNRLKRNTALNSAENRLLVLIVDHPLHRKIHLRPLYVFGNPPYGMKLGDDAEEIDLDVTLEKYDLTKNFLLRILGNFARDVGLHVDAFLTDGARDRLVLASGGVARDFLTIFRRALDIARERIARGEMTRGERIRIAKLVDRFVGVLP